MNTERVVLRDVVFEKTVADFAMPQMCGSDACFSHDGNLLHLGGAIWNLKEHPPKVLCKVAGPWKDALAARFSPDDRLLLLRKAGAGGAQTLAVFQIETEQVRQRGKLLTPCLDAAVSPRGRVIATLRPGPRPVELHELMDDALQAKGDIASPGPGNIQAPQKLGETRLAFLSETLLAAADHTSTLHVWDIGESPPKVVLSASGAGEALAVSPDGKLLCAWSKKGFTLWDNERGKPRKRAGVYIVTGTRWAMSPLEGAAFLSRPGRIVTIHHDGSFRYWQLDGESCHEENPLPPQPIGGLAQTARFELLTRKGIELLSAADDGSLCLSSMGQVPFATRLVPVPILPTGATQEFASELLAATPDGNRVLTWNASGDPKVVLWELIGDELRLIDVASTREGVTCGLFSADGKHLAYRQNRNVLLWEVSKSARGVSAWKPRGQVTVTDPVGRARLLNSGQSLLYLDEQRLIGIDGGFLKLWDRDDGERAGKPFQVDAPKAATLTADQRLLGGVFQTPSTRFQFWAIERDAVVDRGKCDLKTEQVISLDTIAFDPARRKLVACSNTFEGTAVLIIDVATGSIDRQWDFKGRVLHARFTPDGRHILTANTNGTLYVLRLAPPPEK
jgi:WD40 repeat protein